MGNRLCQATSSGPAVFAYPAGDPDYKRSNGVPLLRCSVQDF